MIRFTCPSCGLAVSAPEDCAGRTTKCRGCNNPIVVPQAAMTPASVRPAKSPVLHDKNDHRRVVSPTPTNAKPPVASIPSPARHNYLPSKTEKPPKPIASVSQQPEQPRKRSMLSKLAMIGAGVLLIFGAGGLFGIGVYRYLDSQKKTGNASGTNSYAELPVNPPQPPRDPVPPREPQASKQAQVPASEKPAETNREQQPGARRQQRPSGLAAEEVDGDALLQALKKALEECLTPSTNVFKRRQALKKYFATLNSYRGRRIRLRVQVSRVSDAAVEIDRLPFNSGVLSVDFSGMDFGTDLYTENTDNANFHLTRVGQKWPLDGSFPLRNLIPGDKLASKEDLHHLDKGDSLLIRGRIVSLTQFIRNYDWQEPWNEKHILLSLKVEHLDVRRGETKPPAARAPQTRKRDSNHTLLWLHDALEAKRLGAVMTEDFLSSTAEVPIIRNCCRRIWKIQTVDDQTIQRVADWLAEKKGLPLEKVWALPLKEVATALQEEARKH